MVVVDAEIGFCCNLYILCSYLHGSSSADKRGRSQYKLPEPGYFAYVFIILGSIILCCLYKQSLSGQAQFSLQLRGRAGPFFFGGGGAHEYKSHVNIFGWSALAGGREGG